jgi:hypothetical protein
MPYKLSYWYNRGEKDYGEHNEYNPPNSKLEIALDPNERVREKMRAENRAYREGYANAKEQDDLFAVCTQLKLHKLTPS